jgi:hypothetical protein
MTRHGSRAESIDRRSPSLRWSRKRVASSRYGNRFATRGSGRVTRGLATRARLGRGSHRARPVGDEGLVAEAATARIQTDVVESQAIDDGFVSTSCQ